MLELISFILSVSGLVFGLYYWIFLSPRIIFKISGEQLGEPIKILPSCKVLFAISTKSYSTVNILRISILFDDSFVNLFSTKGITKEISVDRKYPMVIFFSEIGTVVKNTFHAKYFELNAKQDIFP